MSGPIITIRRHTTESGKHGWRWTCRLCRAAGMHHHDRWTDYVLGKYGKADPHPQQRCLVGAEHHVFRAHRVVVVQPGVQVNVYIGRQP